jgi:hypothetical protein
MRIFALYRIAFIFLFLPLFTNALEAGDKVVSKEFITEPPTLISLGFEWQIDGDDNRNAEVAVSYREKGNKSWKQELPLLRLQGEPTVSGPMAYTAPNLFAGSLFSLEPGTEYECRFILTDPDGVAGKTEVLVTVHTRSEPMPFAGGRVYHVYPGGYKGPKQAPAFTGLGAAYFMGSSHTDKHSILIDYDVFQKVSAPDPSDPRKLYDPDDFDFRPRPGSAAMDAGIRLFNVNDDFTGRAPDLEAYETDRPLPHYGPRP